MEPEEQLQDVTNVSAVAGIALAIMSLFTLFLPRRLALCPLLITVGLMPLGQQILIGGLHFTMVRLLLVVAVARVFLRGEARIEWTRGDTIFVWWTVVTIVFGSMFFGLGGSPVARGIDGSPMALLVSRGGDAFNAAMCFFFVRCIVRDYRDIVTGIRTLAFVSLPIAVLMLIEKATAHNLLSVFGGVSEITVEREGHLRCQGAFRHPILAGAFGATLIPLSAGLWACRARFLSLVGIVSGLVIAITASSSGALIVLGGVFNGLLMWWGRKYLRGVRWTVVLLVIFLSIAMQAPVWYTIARASNVFGGTGWHRAYLIDQTLSHFNEWWLFGTNYTAHWGPAGQVIETNPNMMDITNHYIMEGIKGGLAKMVLFIALIVACFRRLGLALSVLPRKGPATFLTWTLGVSLFGHCLCFISITYFDQLIIIWFWLLAVILSIPILYPQPLSAILPNESSNSNYRPPPLRLPRPTEPSSHPLRR
jgi:hypothetical protein